MKQFSIVLLFLALFAACKNDETDIAPSEQQKVVGSPLMGIASDSAEEYYISGEFDGHNICLTNTFGESFPYQDTGANAIFLNASVKLDNIHLYRMNKDRRMFLAIYFDQAGLQTRPLPYIMPHVNLAECESVQMTLRLNYAQPDDKNNNYHAHTNRDDIKVQVTSFDNNIIEGTFKGRLCSPSGSKIVVNNGRFRSKLYIINFGAEAK